MELHPDSPQSTLDNHTTKKILNFLQTPFFRGSILYITFFALIALVMRWLTLYYLDLGFSSGEIGLILSTQRLSSILLSPLVVWFADKTGRARLLAQISLGLSIISFLMIPKTAKHNANSNYNVTQVNFLPVYIAITFWNIMFLPQASFLDALILKLCNFDKGLWAKTRLWGAVSWGIMHVIIGASLPKTVGTKQIQSLDFSIDKVNQQYMLMWIGFPTIGCLLAIFTQMYQPVHTSKDSNMKFQKSKKLKAVQQQYEMAAQDSPEKIQIDQQNLNGVRPTEIGHGSLNQNTDTKLTNLNTNLDSAFQEVELEQVQQQKDIVKLTQTNDTDISRSGRVAAGPLESDNTNQCSTVTTAADSHKEIESPESESNPDSESVNFHLMYVLLSKHRIFFLNLTVIGGGFTLVESLLFIALEQLNASPTLCGLSVLTTVLFELPIFQYATTLLYHPQIGPKRMILIGQFAWIIRALFYAWMPTPYYVLFIEPLHGITFALVWTAAIHVIDEHIAPDKMKTTGQGLLRVSFGGIGAFVSTLGGGWLFEKVGYKLTFVIASGINGISMMRYYYGGEVE